MYLNSFLLIAISILIFIILIYFYLTKNKKQDLKWKRKVINNLKTLNLNFKSNNNIVLKNLIIDLDKLLDYSLKNYGFLGNTFAEKLKKASKIYDKNLYNKIWKAHKERNSLIHELEYSLSNKYLKELGLYFVEAIKILIK